MKSGRRLALLVCLATLPTGAALETAAASSAPAVTNQATVPGPTLPMAVKPAPGKKIYFVTMKEGRTRADVAAKLSAKARRESARVNVFIQDMSEQEAAELRRDENVLAVEEDSPMDIDPLRFRDSKPLTPAALEKLRALARKKSGPSLSGDGSYTPDPNLPPLNGFLRMGIPAFPVARINDFDEEPDIDIAILDSGINPHVDLNIVHSYSLISLDHRDDVGHGTRVAGVLAARDNGVGVTGVIPGARLWNIKFSNSFGSDWSFFLDGLLHILDNADKISVVNISYGNVTNTAPVATIRATIQQLVRAGVVVVAAAGNSDADLAGTDGIYGTRDDYLPASFPEAMAVSAVDTTFEEGTTTPKDRFWYREPGRASNFSEIPQPVPTNNPAPTVVYPVSPGNGIDVAAPGVDIPTTDYVLDEDGIARGYIVGTGTSGAAPHVAGLVGLYILANGRAHDEKGVYKIRQAIIDASQPQSQWNSADTGDPDSNPEPMAIASEVWIPQPVITNVSGGPGNFQFSFNTIPGYEYTAQSATNLTPPVAWTNLVTVGTSANSNVVPVFVTDTNAASQSFYRVARQSLVGRVLILAQPQSRTNLVGTLATLSVTAIGEAPSYHWHKDGLPLTDDGNISGATAATLTLTGVQLTNAGDYTVVISNVHGSVTSAVATLTVIPNTLTEDLLLWLRFDGDALDASGNERHGVVQGAVASTNRFGQPDSAFGFNGSAVVSVANLDPDDYANGFSFGAWIQPAGSGGSPAYWVHDGDWGSTYIILAAPSGLSFRLGSGSSSTAYGVSGLNLTLGQWHHLVVTHDANWNRLYVNGVLAFEAPSLPLQGNVATLAVGADGYVGNIDELVVYGRGLMAHEVMVLYDMGLPADAD